MSRADHSRPTAPLRENHPHYPSTPEPDTRTISLRDLFGISPHLASYGLSVFIKGEPDDEYTDMNTEVLQWILQNLCALSKLGSSLPDSTSAHSRGAGKVGPTGSHRKVT